MTIYEMFCKVGVIQGLVQERMSQGPGGLGGNQLAMLNWEVMVQVGGRKNE